MSSGEEETHNIGENGPQQEISGWADAMSKILGSNKPKKKKAVILSRAKKDYEVKKTPKPGESFEIVPGEIGNGSELSTTADKEKVKKRKKPSDGDDEDVISLKSQRKSELQQKRIQKEWENINRVKPNPTEDRDTERELMKIATKGVVELFNAVNLQKKSLSKKLRTAPRSEFKKDKIIGEAKDLFEDALDAVQKKKR